MDSIISEITDYLNEFMVFGNEDQAIVMALWIIHTWTFSEGFPRTPYTTPYIYIHSPTKQSGKTLLLDLIEPLVRNPERGVDYTPSTLFRLVESVSPTLMIDEADAMWSGAKNEAMRGVVNGGYKRGGYVWRTEAGEPTKFRTFCAKVFAGIDNGLLPDTIQDRCIPLTLKRKTEAEKRTVYYSYKVADRQEELVEKIVRWVGKNGTTIVDYDPEPTPGISPRAWEITMPLIQIAKAAKCEKLAREATTRLLTARPTIQSPEAVMLTKIREAFASEAGWDGPSGNRLIFTRDLVAALGEGWTPKLLSVKLRPFDVPTGTHRRGNETLKGYKLADFADCFSRYL